MEDIKAVSVVNMFEQIKVEFARKSHLNHFDYMKSFFVKVRVATVLKLN